MTLDNSDTLYIRLSRTKFVFARYDRLRNATLNYVCYDVKPDVSLNANVHDALARVPLCEGRFREVRVLVDGDVTLVPLSEFDEESCEDMYFFNLPEKRRHRRVFYDTLPHQSAMLLFSIDKDVAHTLKEAFPGVVFQSSETPLLLHFASCSPPSVLRRRLFAGLHDDRLTLCAFNAGRIESFNVYRLHHSQDAVYCTLYFAKLLQMKPETDEVYLSAPDETSAGLLEKLKTYLPNSFLLKPEEEFGRNAVALSGALPYDFIVLLLRAF